MYYIWLCIGKLGLVDFLECLRSRYVGGQGNSIICFIIKQLTTIVNGRVWSIAIEQLVLHAEYKEDLHRQKFT